MHFDRFLNDQIVLKKAVANVTREITKQVKWFTR